MRLGQSLNQLQQIANIVCFQIDYKRKHEAQLYFCQFIKTLTPQLSHQICLYGSQTFLFVLFQYLSKFLEHFSSSLLHQIFLSIEQIFSTWYKSQNHIFIRKYKQEDTQLQKYVMGSIQLFFSNCMKKFFIVETTQKRMEIVHWIKAKHNQRYRLYLFKLFIENVSQIDSTMGFIKFRTLSYNFQQQVIPIIAKQLIPFFYKIEHIIQVNELSCLQQHLQVAQSRLTVERQSVFKSSSQLRFTSLVFCVLHSLVFYNFHLTYTQYQQDSTFQNCLISFPQQFTSSIVTQQFIHSISYVLQRLIDLMIDSQFLTITLGSLQKIFLTKLTYVNQDRKIKFVKQCLQMLAKLIHKNNLNTHVVTKLMVCNNKFLNNVETNFMKTKPQLKQAFQKWLIAVTNVIMMVMGNINNQQYLNFNQEDSLIIQCIELYIKIASNVCCQTNAQWQLDTNHTKWSQQQVSYVSQTINSLIRLVIQKTMSASSSCLICPSTLSAFCSNIVQIKSFCNSFIHPFRQLSSLHYNCLFQQMEKNFRQLFILDHNLLGKFNALIFVTELMDRNYLERNLMMQKADQYAIKSLSNSIQIVFNYLQFYVKNKGNVLNQQIKLIDIAVLVFLEKLLSQFLSCFQTFENQFQIKHKIFMNMLKSKGQSTTCSKFSQQLLLFCIQTIISYLLIYKQNQESKNINEFIFETINKVLMKFKWGIKRDIFKNSAIYQRLAQFFSYISKQSQIVLTTNVININNTNNQINNYSNNPINSINSGINQSNDYSSVYMQFRQLKWRKKLLKIISLLFFDDVIDDYKSNLDQIFNGLKSSHILLIMLDLEGMCLAIDTTSIYKYFLQKLQTNFPIPKFTESLIQISSHYTSYEKVTSTYPKIKILKQILKLHSSLLMNKGQRINNSRNLQGVYNLVVGLMAYWIQIINMVNSQEYVGVLRQIMVIVTELIKCDKINFYQLQRITPHHYFLFFTLLFKKLVSMVQQIQEYPKLYQQFLQFMLNISRQLLDTIFFPTNLSKNMKVKNLNQIQQQMQQIKQNFMYLFSDIFKKVGLYLQQSRSNNSLHQSSLDKCLQICKFTLCFLHLKVSLFLNHRCQLPHLLSLISLLQPSLALNLHSIFTYLLQQKHFTIHKRLLILILFQGNVVYQGLIRKFVQGMGLPTHASKETKEMLQYANNHEQQNFIEGFKRWVKVINMTEDELKKDHNDHHQFYSFMGII